MLRSSGVRFLIVGLLTLLMFIPLFFVGVIIDDRVRYSRSAADEVGREWGGPQVIKGPVLVIPVTGPVTRQEQTHSVDPARATAQVTTTEKTTIEYVRSVIVYPRTLDVTVDTETQIRSRGIFDIPVYGADMEVAFDFDLASAADLVRDEETIIWHEATVQLYLNDNRGLRGAASLKSDGQDIPLEPALGRAGVQARVGDPRDLGAMQFALGLNGAQRLSLSPVGRDTSVQITSDWPHPSFVGGFLPDEHEVTDAGFTASWTIPHLARNMPQQQRAFEAQTNSDYDFGVRFYTPNDFYQKASRAASYSILFIALTFLTVLLIDGQRKQTAHPVQYILIGLAQCVFVLLMVAYAEQIGFAMAYLGAGAATIGLLVLFGWTGLQMGKRAFVLGAMLIVLYAVLYLILRSADYALLAGASLAFVALAVTMIATRNEDWWGPVRDPKPNAKLWGPRDKREETQADG